MILRTIFVEQEDIDEAIANGSGDVMPASTSCPVVIASNRQLGGHWSIGFHTAYRDFGGPRESFLVPRIAMKFIIKFDRRNTPEGRLFRIEPFSFEVEVS